MTVTCPYCGQTFEYDFIIGWVNKCEHLKESGLNGVLFSDSKIVQCNCDVEELKKKILQLRAKMNMEMNLLEGT